MPQPVVISFKQKLLIGAGVLGLMVLYSSAFVVDQTEQAIILEFKKPVEIIKKPGLKFKAPWQTVQFFDKRLLDYVSNQKTVIAGDLKRLEVNAYVKYRISDPLKYLQTAKTEFNLIGNLDPILESSMRKVISEEPLNAILTEKRDDVMAEIKSLVNVQGKNYGIEVADVRIMRADFPEKNRSDIYSRMRSEREREAKDLRAKGAEEATKITAQADRERTKIISEATQKSETIKGEGDGEAGKIYADAFSRDPEFYKFYRSMEAYRGSLKKGDTSVVLSPKNDFLKYMDKQ